MKCRPSLSLRSDVRCKEPEQAKGPAPQLGTGPRNWGEKRVFGLVPYEQDRLIV